MEAKLVVVGGKANMGEVKLRLPMTIGRGRKADLIISHPTVSRIHCELYEKEGTLVVRDNGSSNGTLIDDRQIKEAVIEPGQVLKIGPLSFRAEYEWSGAMPDLNATAEVRDLTATQTMSSDELPGDSELSDATVPPQSPKKAKPAASAPAAKQPAVARAKPEAEAPAKKPKQAAPPPSAAPAPAVTKGADTQTFDSESFNFDKDIEFVDDASQATVAPAPKPDRAVLPTVEFEPLGDLTDEAEAAAPEIAAKGEPQREANFDFLEELGAADEAPPVMEAAEDMAAPFVDEPAPAASMPLIEPEGKDDLDFDFLAELEAPPAASEPAVMEVEPQVAPPPEPVKSVGPVEQALFDEPAPPASAPIAEVEAKEELEFDFLAEFEAPPAADAPEAMNVGPQIVPPVEAVEAAPPVEEAIFDEPVVEPSPEPQAVFEIPVEPAPPVEEADFDFLAETASEPSPAIPEVANVVEPPTSIPDVTASDEDLFADFLAEEPAKPAVEEPPPVEEVAKSEEPEWTFDVEPEPAAEVVEPFVEAMKPTVEEAEPTIEPPAEASPAAEVPIAEEPVVEEPVAEQPVAEEPGFDFLDELEPAAAAEPAQDEAPPPSPSAADREAEPTIDFRGSAEEDKEEAPIESPFSFGAPDAIAPEAELPPADEPTAEAAFAEETSSEMTRPEPAFAFGEEQPAAEPKIAPAAAAPRPAGAKKPSLFDKIKLLFAGSAKKKSAKPAKGKSPAAKKPAETLEDVAAMAAAPFVVPSFTPPRQDDAPIPLFDDVAAPPPEAASQPAADEFVDEFLNEPSIPLAEDAPIESEPAPPAAATDIEELVFADEAPPLPAESEAPPIDVLDDAAALFGESPAAEVPTEPAPPAAEDDFAAFLADEAPAPTADKPPAMESSPTEPESAEVVDLPADEDLFPIEADTPTEEPVAMEESDAPAWTTDVAANESSAAEEAANGDELLFAAEPAPAESLMPPAPVEEVLAEAPPTTTPATRHYSIDVDTRLTASHRAFARVAVRTPRIDVPRMEPDVPAGRNFNRTGPATVAAAAASQPIEAPAPVAEEPAMIAPAEEFTATSDDVVATPPQRRDDAELDDFLNDLGMGEEPNRPR